MEQQLRDVLRANPDATMNANYVLGGTVALGGLFGYARKGSLPSLLAGLVIGPAVAYAGHAISQGDINGYYASLGATSLLTLVMSQRYLSTRKVMPAGLVATLSAAVGGLTALEYYLKQNK
eukprot:Unigene2818_Nuclearia_a/m.8720 Unigene2818_Nuclearia_a/g.8720  ORF Unigene2818_Nuclearia_a/g.8720 Unigene2818_Nuclearia_a/m.8720 type:complete len:121 (-) Unigene2818_Nuclearia_a:69-431(-)